MYMREYILAINPGSTSTKAAIFRGEESIKQVNLSHIPDEIKRFERVVDQFQFRMDAILKWLEEEGIGLDTLSAVVGRGGILRPMPGGTYKVTKGMIDDLKSEEREQHVSNIGAILANGIAEGQDISSFIVDPVAVDEFQDVAKVSGLPELPRRSLVHALNVKAVSRRAAWNLKKRLEDTNLVVAHLGGGITISPVKGGRIIDANVASDGGPFSPDRSGSLPSGDLVRLCFSGKYTQKEIKKKSVGEGGLIGYLGTNDLREIIKRIEGKDMEAKKVFEAMCYQISKEIAAMACVLSGNVDAVVLTGGLAYSKELVEFVSDRVKFISQIMVIPGEDEMLSLAQGANRVLKGEEKAKIYEDEVFVK
jgi:butyrate kinase